eukprot:254243-Chlamydomonas_euryale.AAC.1
MGPRQTQQVVMCRGRCSKVPSPRGRLLASLNAGPAWVRCNSSPDPLMDPAKCSCALSRGWKTDPGPRVVVGRKHMRGAGMQRDDHGSICTAQNGVIGGARHRRSRCLPREHKHAPRRAVHHTLQLRELRTPDLPTCSRAEGTQKVHRKCSGHVLGRVTLCMRPHAVVCACMCLPLCVCPAAGVLETTNRRSMWDRLCTAGPWSQEKEGETGRAGFAFSKPDSGVSLGNCRA